MLILKQKHALTIGRTKHAKNKIISCQTPPGKNSPCSVSLTLWNNKQKFEHCSIIKYIYLISKYIYCYIYFKIQHIDGTAMLNFKFVVNSENNVWF